MNISAPLSFRAVELIANHHEYRESNPRWLSIENPRLDWLKYLYIRLDITRKIMLDGVLLCPDSRARSLTVALLLKIRVELCEVCQLFARARILKYQKDILHFSSA